MDDLLAVRLLKRTKNTDPCKCVQSDYPSPSINRANEIDCKDKFIVSPEYQIWFEYFHI